MSPLTYTAKLAAIHLMLPELVRQRVALRRAGYEPRRVVLPACFDPGPYEGEDATGVPATIMGLPVKFEGATIMVLTDESVDWDWPV